MTSFGQLLAACVASLYLAHGAAATTGEAVSDKTFLPVRYAADRFFVTTITVFGQELALFTDTGGGTNMIYRHAVVRLGLQGQAVEIGGETSHVTSLPLLLPAASIPLPSALSAYGPHFLRTDAPEQSEGSDGFLGRTWFAGRVRELDYPRRSLALLDGVNPSGISGGERVRLGFQTDASGNQTTHFPRIGASFDGEAIPVRRCI